MWEIDLRLVCITLGSFERAVKIGKSVGPDDGVWEVVRLDIERRSVMTEWHESAFECCGMEDLLQKPAVMGVRFKLAAFQVRKTSGMPLEIAEDALVEVVNQGKVRAWRNHPGRLEEFGPNWPLKQPVDAETQIHGAQLVAWMAAEFAPEPEVVVGAAPEAQCRELLTREMRKSPESSFKPKPEWLAEAQRQFPGLSKNAFNRAWDRAKEDTRSKRGEPGWKSSQ